MRVDITIIMPVYNSAEFLSASIESVLNQQFPNFELILINDGSTDDSERICKKYAEKDKRIKLICTDNQGVSAARNIGLSMAKGRYIGFVDSDDYIHEAMFKLLFEKCVATNSDVGIIGLKEVDKKGTILSEYVPDNICLQEIMKRAYPCNKLIKSELFHEKNLYFIEGKFYEDVDLISKIYVSAKKVCSVDKIGYYYVKHESSTTANRDGRILDNLWAYGSFKKYLQEQNLFSLYEAEFQEACKYFKNYFLNILYDYPTMFILKNYRRIDKEFSNLDRLSFKEKIFFAKRHIIYSIKKSIFNIKAMFRKLY